MLIFGVAFVVALLLLGVRGLKARSRAATGSDVVDAAWLSAAPRMQLRPVGGDPETGRRGSGAL